MRVPVQTLERVPELGYCYYYYCIDITVLILLHGYYHMNNGINNNRH